MEQAAAIAVVGLLVVALARWLWSPTQTTRPRRGPNAGRTVVTSRRYQEFIHRPVDHVSCWWHHDGRLARRRRAAEERRIITCEVCQTSREKGGPQVMQVMKVDAETGRRRKMRLCPRCFDDTYDAQTALLRARSLDDWGRPIPDQYPGMSRSLLRAFLDSPETERIIGDTGPTAATLNGTIIALGFGGELYAEDRSGLAVLRRAVKHPTTTRRDEDDN